jgi:molecular chaperone HscC
MIIGIDLGTSNSLVGIWRDGKAVLIPNSHGENLTPSIVGFADDGALLVGKTAAERLITHPSDTTATFKRYMGSNRSVKVGKNDYRAEELSAMILRSLKADAEAFLGHEVTEAIITVPAYFNDTQRKATRAAGEIAGLNVDRLLNEPTAAALAYGLHSGSAESKFLVFDLGGGTFDVSILEMFDGVIEVRASTGDNFLGGEDFVELLVNEFVKRVGKENNIAQQNRPVKLEQRLRAEAERVKRALTTNDAVEMRIDWEDKPITTSVSVDDFAKLCESLLARLRTPLERALRDARIRVSELDNIVLAGGATRMPMVRRMVATLFGRLPAQSLNPDEVVAIGAATQAGLKMHDSALSEVVLTDVCPYTLGIDVAEQISESRMSYGLFSPIIERNTVIPASRSKEYWTMEDFQKAINLSVYQGEARLVKDNIFLGKLAVKVPSKKAGEVSIDVRFTYDVNGLLEVEVTVPLTGEKKTLVIEENPGTLSSDDIAAKFAKLAAIKIHPRDQDKNRATLSRANRIFEESLGELRAAVSSRISVFEAILEKQNPSDVEHARKALEEFLGQIENDRFL